MKKCANCSRVSILVDKELIKVLKQNGIEFVYNDEAIETHHIDGNRNNNTKENLTNLCIKCHDRRSAVKIANIVRSGKVGFRPPFGYKIEYEKDGMGNSIPSTGRLVPDEKHIDTIKRILNEPPEMGIIRLSEKYGLTRAIIRAIRINPIYRTGEVYWQGRIAHKVKPIIEL